MDAILVGLLVMVIWIGMNALTPRQQPPQIIQIQVEPVEQSDSLGCLPLIIIGVLVLVLARMA